MTMDLISFLRLWIRGAALDGLSPAEICREVNEVALPAAAGKARLPLRARFYLAVRGFFPVITLKTPRGLIPFYLVRCKRHGLYLDYPHGYDECFICPKCLRESAVTRIRPILERDAQHHLTHQERKGVIPLINVSIPK